MHDSRTNATAQQMADALSACESFVICGHVNPDGDCLGSALTLMHALRSLGKRADVLLVEDSPLEPGLLFLPGIDEFVPAERYAGNPQAFVYVDVSVRDRIKAAAAIADRATCRFAIDHHAGTDDVAELCLIDPDAASCTMLVWDVVCAMGVEPSREMALCAYTGLMTDTGRFQYQNTDEQAFLHAAEMVAMGADPSLAGREFFQNRSMASLNLEHRMVSRMEILMDGQVAFSYITLADFTECGAENSDAEALIDTLRSVRGVRAACILKERNGFVRGSLRAKDDDTDVAAMARVLGGGGHKAAAGFTLEVSLEEAISQVKDELARL
ncbi:MAG: DHH family phosphoesterase [Coriobacteriia bacterium]|nr:DHH family phosphoesterase [Coriobacteriia bacterium]